MKIVIDLDAVLYNRIFVNSQADPYDMVKARLLLKKGYLFLKGMADL